MTQAGKGNLPLIHSESKTKRTHKASSIERVLGAGGLVAESFAGFEVRPQQLEMAAAVRRTLSKGGRLVVEAGTGVGKSFAYLVPAIETLSQAKAKILISTYTITLQEQLINKDIPFLADCLPQKFTAVLAKGRGNYLCRRRLEFALGRQRGLFDDFGGQLESINDWAGRTKNGSLSDISFTVNSRVWDAVKSEHGNCRSSRCPFFQKCFYFRARRLLDAADIIVANHALMFSDLVLKENQASVLPDYGHVIIDEAHNIEHVAEEHFGINLSNRMVRHLLDGLYNPRTHKGLLSSMDSQKTIDTAAAAAEQANVFFKKVQDWYQQSKDQAGRCYRNFIDDNLSGHLKNLRSALNELAAGSEDIDEKLELVRYTDRCGAFIESLNCFLSQDKKEYVYWVEEQSGMGASVCLKSAAINVGEDVKRCLFDKYGFVVLTSATLSSGSTGQKSDFDFFAGRIGLEDFEAVKLGSPFDYSGQVTMYIEKDLPDPNHESFVPLAAQAAKKYIHKTKGRAFVLFTSYTMLESIAEAVADWLDEQDIQLLVQTPGVNRTALLNSFKTSARCVLFGTDTFWQGVDVPGESLSNVIIVRLPFAVPNRPLTAGRIEQINQQGGNAFFDYQLPLAIIKFKQGFGRLIRTAADTGIIAILDSRIINKRYGARFLAAVPQCKTEIVVSEK